MDLTHLARELDVDRRTLRRVLRGEPVRPSTARRIARGLRALGYEPVTAEPPASPTAEVAHVDR